MRFNQLETTKFNEKMKPAASDIYQKIFPGCRVIEIDEARADLAFLDRRFGVDRFIMLRSGQFLTVQEKFRKNYALQFADFTMEYQNGDGTKGEYYHLGAQLYFYGWADEKEADFIRWVLLDVVRLKLLFDRVGGVETIGELKENRAHGSSTFYSLPFGLISNARLYSYLDFMEVDSDNGN